jgi:hypothetical protein
MSKAWASALLIVLLSACHGVDRLPGPGNLVGAGGGSGLQIPPPDDDALPLDEFTIAQAGLTCLQAANCMGGLYAAWLGQGDVCARFITITLMENVVYVASVGIAEGRLVFDPEAGQRCLSSISPSACNFFEDIGSLLPKSCSDVFQGQVENGGECYLHEECATGFCVLDAEAPSAMCQGAGQCQRFRRRDSECRSDVECFGSLRCLGLLDGVGHCGAVADAGDACNESTSCRVGHRCVDELCEPDRYEARLDEPCGWTDGAQWCEPGLACVSTGVMVDGAQEWACRELLDPGEPCRQGYAFVCKPSAVCRIDPESPTGEGECVLRPLDGELCLPQASINPFLFQCGVGLTCVEDSFGDSRCYAWKRLGETCLSDSLCFSGHCGAESRICEPPFCRADPEADR